MANPGIAVPGSNVPSASLVVPGGAQGIGGPTGPTGATGATGPGGPTAVSTDTNNLATLGSDSLILVPASAFWNQRLRSFNAVGNPNFEVAQRNVGTSVVAPATGSIFVEDRWYTVKNSATLTYSLQSVAATASDNLVIPYTNFAISQRYVRITLTGQQTTLTTNQCLQLVEAVEGPNGRELSRDVHSLSVLVRTSITSPMPYAFSIALRDSAAAYSLVLFATITKSNTWQIVNFAGLPVFPTGGGSFPLTPGAGCYSISIVLAAGPTLTAPVSTGAWQTGNFIADPNAYNFAAQPVGTTFDIAFVQHEPTPYNTTYIDKPFQQNLDECLRYYQKTYSYGTAVGTATAIGSAVWTNQYTGGGVNPSSYYPFQKSMAKIPTMTAYSPGTGAANYLRDESGAADVAVTGFINTSDKGYRGLTATVGAGVRNLSWHYIADTGF